MCQLRQFQVAADYVRVIFRTLTFEISFGIEFHFGIVLAVVFFAVNLRLHIVEAYCLLIIICIGIRYFYLKGFLTQIQGQHPAVC